MTTATQPVRAPTDLERLEQTLTEAAARYDAEWQRARTLKRRNDELHSAIAAETDETKRNRLRKERVQITADLFHVPGDVAGAAANYATTLQAWGYHALRLADSEMRAANAELAQPLREMRQQQEKYSPSQPMMARTSQGDAAARREVERLAHIVQPIQTRLSAARDRRAQILERLARRFGDLMHDGSPQPGGVQRFVDGARAQARREL